MKSTAKLLSICLIMALVSGLPWGCQTGSKKTMTAADLPPRDPPKIEIPVKVNNLPQGLKSLSGRRVTAILVYNLPDSYLIKAKNLFNPPDYAAQEVINLQTDRQEWVDEMVVTYCDVCKNINTEIPFKTLPEKILLGLIDKASLNQDLTTSDIESLSPYYKNAEVLWVILGSENYEQRRGETGDALMISSVAENTVTLRSYIFDVAKKSLLNRTTVEATDKDFLVYEKVRENAGTPTKKPQILYDKMKEKFWPMPVGVSYDSPKYDEIYPYPPVPESSYIIKKGLSALGESLNP